MEPEKVSVKASWAFNKLLIWLYMYLTLLHSEQPKLYGVLAILSAIGLRKKKVAVNANLSTAWISTKKI